LRCYSLRSLSLAVRTVVAIVAARSALKVIARATVAAPPAMQREAVTLVLMAVLANPLIAGLCLLGRWLLAASDERRQAIDVAAIVMCDRLVRALYVNLLLRLLLVLLRRRERLSVTRQERLRLARSERRLARERLLIAVILIKRFVAGAARPFVLGAGEMGIALAKLLLRSRDQTVVVLRMLVVVFRRNRIAGGLGIAGELNVFFSDVGGVTSNFDVRAVRFVNTGHRIVAFAMAAAMPVIVVTVAMAAVTAATHALVLTVSHDLPVR